MVIARSMVIVLATVVLATPALCVAQSERGSITGVIQDTTKAPIPGVSVKVINTATNATMKTWGVDWEQASCTACHADRPGACR